MFPKSLSRALRLWHRRIGIVIAMILILVSVTGIALNHVTGLRLDRIMIASPAMLALYDIPQASEETVAFKANEYHVTSVGNRLFVDGTQVLGKMGPLVGAAATEQFMAAAEPNRLHLLLSDGQFVESLSLSQIDAPLTGLTSDGTHFIALTEAAAYKGNVQLSRWEPVTRPALGPQATALPAALQSDINQHLSGEGLPLYRIVLDVHSGRILGRIGPWLMDLAGLLTIVLSITGLWMWLGRGR